MAQFITEHDCQLMRNWPERNQSGYTDESDGTLAEKLADPMATPWLCQDGAFYTWLSPYMERRK